MVSLVKRGVLLRYAGKIIHASSSITFLKCRNRNILVDTGSGSDRKWVIHRLGKMNLSPEKIDCIVITHEHQDHTGNTEIFNEAEIYSAGNMDEFNDLFSPELTLIETPGHTSDHISLISRCENGVYATAGDAIPTENNLMKLIPPLICEDRKRSFRSMMKLVKMADFIIPGHGGIVMNPHRKIKKKRGESI